jgi:hypothetical protein
MPQDLEKGVFMIMLAQFEVTGVSPLLQHNPQGMRGSGNTDPTVARVPKPEVEAEAGTYRLPDGSLYMPSIAFRTSLLRGCKGMKIGKYSAVSRVCATAFTVEDRTPLIHPQTKEPIKEWEVHTCRAVIQRNGVLRSRPLIREWQAIVVLECDDRFATPESLLIFFNLAGRLAGIGDFRPEKKGPFGRYEVKLFNGTMKDDSKESNNA